MKSVSENIDDLLAKTTDAATGASVVEKAKAAFQAHVAQSEEVAWLKAIEAAGGTIGRVSAAESLHMGGHDYAMVLKHPDWSPISPDEMAVTAYHDFANTGINPVAAHGLAAFWREYYGSVEYSKNVQEAQEPKMSPKGFIQIGGDFGDAWDSGGTWFNPETGTIIHHEELSHDEWNGPEGSDKRIDGMLTQENYRTIAASVTAENDEAWEAVEDEIREAYASQLKNQMQFPYYETTTEDDATIESDWADTIADIKQEFENGEELWAGLPPEQKLVEIANRIGWHEFDYSPYKATKAELSAILGIDL